MTQRAGHIVNEEWKLPDAAFVIPQTGLIGEYDFWSAGAVEEENLPLLLDNKTTTYFQLASVLSITFGFNSARKVDCLAFAGDDIDNVSLSYLNEDTGFFDSVFFREYNGQKSGMIVFEPIFKKEFRIIIQGQNVKMRQLSLGKALQFPYAVDQGFQTPAWRSNDKVVHWQSNAPLPSTVIRRLHDVNMNFSQLPVRWMKKQWEEISRNNKSVPMWFAWDLNNDPDGVVYGPWTQQPISYDRPYLTSLRLNVNGLL